MKNITFHQLKKYICESYDVGEYEEILCELFEVDDISEITKENYNKLLQDYEHDKLNEHDSSLLEEATLLVHQAANENGYNIIAHHGTTVEFSEFEYGDIGFHVGSLDQAEVAASRHDNTNKKNIIYLNTAISLHNPLVINYDLGNWYPNEIFDGACTELNGYFEKERKKYPSLKRDELYNKIEDKLKNVQLGTDWEWDGVAQLYFLFNELNFSISKIKKYNFSASTMQKKVILDKLISRGYDGIKYLNFYETKEGKPKEYSYILLDANQIKNCEVISFSNGKVVPLENRFNKNTNNLFETI